MVNHDDGIHSTREAAPVPWSTLPAELLGTIFGSLEIKERCQIIPFICKAFNIAHRSYPPLLRCLHAHQAHPKDLQLFSLIAPGLEELRIATPDPHIWEGWEASDQYSSDETCNVAVDQSLNLCGDGPYDEWDVALTLLTRAAREAPRLQKLVFDFQHHWEDKFLFSLLKFTGLRRLEIWNYWVDPDPSKCMFGTVYSYIGGKRQGYNYMAGMHSLKEFCMGGLDISAGHFTTGEMPPLAVTKEWVDALWHTLAILKNLNKLDLRIRNSWGDRGIAWRPCPDQHHFQPMSQLTQIRELCLDLHNNTYRDCRQRDEYMNTASFGKLTQLTKLHCCFYTSTAVYKSISSLVLLKELTLGINFQLPDLPSLSLALPELTYLKLKGMLSLDSSRRGVLGHLLPPQATTFPNLVSFKCSRMALDRLPTALTQKLTGLTSLALPGNRIQRLPSTLTCFQRLRVLDVSENDDLQLKWEDLDVFPLLPELQTIDAHRYQTPVGYLGTHGHWDVQSLSVWSSLKGRLPHLDVIGAEPAGTKAY